MAQVSSKRNKKASAEHTRTSGRRQRIAREVNAGANNRGDFANSRAMKQNNKTLAQQNFGTHKSRYNDLIAAFGRVTNLDPTGVGGGRAKLSFSAG